MKTVTGTVVTGADGFIGSHLVERLAADGHDVTGLCAYNSAGSVGWMTGKAKAVLGDIRDADFVSWLCRDADLVFHLAALIDIPYSYAAPRSYVDTNVTGTLNVLEAVRLKGKAKLVHVSTSEVYGTPETVPIRETHPLNAQSPYAASKIAADQLALSYHRSFGTDVRILRPFNTYGPRQSTRGVMAHILTQLLTRGGVILGSMDPRRDFTYVSDTVDGIVRAADIPAGETVHLGTGRAVSIGELFHICCRIADVYAGAITDPERVRPPASEVMVLQSDNSKAKALMGWEPKVSLDQGIERTVAWLRSRS